MYSRWEADAKGFTIPWRMKNGVQIPEEIKKWVDDAWYAERLPKLDKVFDHKLNFN